VTAAPEVFVCSHCGKCMSSYADVAYEGPARHGRPDPGLDGCSPFMDWMRLCYDCYKILAAPVTHRSRSADPQAADK
jgi:hypothetical protein